MWNKHSHLGISDIYSEAPEGEKSHPVQTADICDTALKPVWSISSLPTAQEHHHCHKRTAAVVYTGKCSQLPGAW